MISNVTAEVVCVFEHPGTSVDAQQFVMERVKAAGKVSSLVFHNIRIVRWSNPDTNEPRRFEHPDGKLYYRYNAQFTVGFTISGSYAEAQQWILDRLNDGEETSYMNVQSVMMSLSSSQD